MFRWAWDSSTFSSSMPSAITSLQNLGHQNQMHFLFHCERQLFSEASILLWISYFSDEVEMARDREAARILFCTGRQVFCQPVASGCKYFPISVLFDEIFKDYKFLRFLTIFSYKFIIFLQGFSGLYLTPGDAGAILWKAECWLGQEISCKEIEQGQLTELLIADDYSAPSEVFKILPFMWQLLFSNCPRYTGNFTSHWTGPS